MAPTTQVNARGNGMITKGDMKVLEKLMARPLVGPTASDEDIRIVQRLCRNGLARDLSQFNGHRQRVYLRIWSITDAGKAAIAQKVLGTFKGGQPSLISE